MKEETKLTIILQRLVIPGIMGSKASFCYFSLLVFIDS